MQPQSSSGVDLSADDAEFLIDYYREDPAELYTKIFGVRPWDLQVQILEAVFKYPEVAVKSCHGTGKSWNAARIALTFLLTHPGCIVVTTAPTWRQVEDVLWRELRSAYNKAYLELGGRLTKTGLEMDDDWYAIGLSTTEPDKFQGYHSDEVLVIVDEAAGIEEPIFEGIRAITSNQNAHVLYVGNPTTLDGTFYKAFNNPLVKKFTISAFDSPNFTSNGLTSLESLIDLYTAPAGVDALDHLTRISREMTLPYPALVSPSWVYQRWLEWGVDTAMWSARVMGEFPNQSNDALLSLQDVMDVMDKDAPGWGKQKREENPDAYRLAQGHPGFGADIARFGDDRTVIFEGHGSFISPAVVIHQMDNVIVGRRILALIDFDNWNTWVRLDDGGLGGGVTDHLKHYKKDNRKNFRIIPINFGSASLESKRMKVNPLTNQQQKLTSTEDHTTQYANRRAEMYWNLRELIKAKKIWLPDDEELANELASIRYGYDKMERILIEPKEIMKKRTGKSPDKADALALYASGLRVTKKDRLQQLNKPIRQPVVAPTITGGLTEKHRAPVAARYSSGTIMGGASRRY